MNKGMKKMLSVGMSAVMLLNTGLISSAKKTSYVGSYSSYTNRDVALAYAKKAAGCRKSQMPQYIRDFHYHWCSTFVKFLYGHDNIRAYDSIQLTINNTVNEGGRLILDKTVQPQPGDMAIYEENPNGSEPYEHIGLITDAKLVNGSWWVKTIEGNAVDIDWEKDYGVKACDVDNYTYGTATVNISQEDRGVEKFGYNEVRQGQIVGWLSPKTVRKYNLIGDVDGDGEIHMNDAVIIAQVAENRKQNGVVNKSFASKYGVAECFYRCDVNFDGNVTNADYNAIQDYLLRK